MADWRFHLITLPDMQWVDRDLQLQEPNLVESINAPLAITGKLPLGYRMINTPNGKRALVEWGSAIVAEQEGRDPLFGIVDELTTDGDWLIVSAGGFSGYPEGMPWVDGEFSSTGVDPLDVVRLIWSKLQSKPNGDLGVVVDNVKTTTLLGKPEGSRLTLAKARMKSASTEMGYAKEQSEVDAALLQQMADATLAAVGLSPGGLIIRQVSAPSGDKRSKRNVWLKGDADGITEVYTWNGKAWVEVSTSRFNNATDRYFEWVDQKIVLAASKNRYTESKKLYDDAKSAVSDLSEEEAEPYVINWWSNHNLGEIISGLATDTPFDYREETVWTGDDTMSHRLRIGYPNLGVKRENLRLEIGVNVTAPPPLAESEYASEVYVLGAGEGRTMVRASASGNSGRLRRAVVSSEKSVPSKALAQRSARQILSSMDSEWSFEELSLVDHDMCPYGSFDVGDWLYLTGDAGWVNLEQWVRVLEIATDCKTGQISLRVSG